MTSSKTPIIIVKKKRDSHRYHGGAWKVAYADFVTAMMALFIVLWLLNSSERMRKTIGGYFQDPRGVGHEVGLNRAGTSDGMPVKKDDMPKLRSKLEAAMKNIDNFSRIHRQVQMTITAEGLRIELMETNRGFFFENGSANATVEGRELLSALAAEIGKLPNSLLIEGHTDATPFAGTNGYSNWELSADRANSARRVMEQAGLRHEQVSNVRGFADRKLRNTADPRDSANRRVSVVIQYQGVSSNEITGPDPGSHS
jgi:chemotaxis protein MotB